MRASRRERAHLPNDTVSELAGPLPSSTPPVSTAPSHELAHSPSRLLFDRAEPDSDILVRALLRRGAQRRPLVASDAELSDATATTSTEMRSEDGPNDDLYAFAAAVLQVDAGRDTYRRLVSEAP